MKSPGNNVRLARETFARPDCLCGFCYLGVPVLASLGRGHLHNLARASLQHHVAVLTQGGALHRVGGGGARLSAGEVKIGICHDALRLERCRRNSGLTS